MKSLSLQHSQVSTVYIESSLGEICREILSISWNLQPFPENSSPTRFDKRNYDFICCILFILFFKKTVSTDLNYLKGTFLTFIVKCLLESLKVLLEEESKHLRNFFTYNSIHSLSRGWPLFSLNIWWTFQWALLGCSESHHRLEFVQFMLVCLVSTDRVARLGTLSLRVMSGKARIG